MNCRREINTTNIVYQDTRGEGQVVEIHDGQCQFKVPFMLYADFESILKPMNERHKAKMSCMKAERKGKTSFMDKVNTDMPSGWCVYSKFAYGDIPDPLKLYRDEQQFVNHVDKKVKWLYELYQQQTLAELTFI